MPHVAQSDVIDSQKGSWTRLRMLIERPYSEVIDSLIAASCIDRAVWLYVRSPSVNNIHKWYLNFKMAPRLLEELALSAPTVSKYKVKKREFKWLTCDIQFAVVSDMLVHYLYGFEGCHRKEPRCGPKCYAAWLRGLCYIMGTRFYNRRCQLVRVGAMAVAFMGLHGYC